ncbi:hypothetical protein BD560DRAFT_458030 [Blakeslea trispora]|nr:hypothetical protein BD560DRAFT_458030 [Blakeslea trispora]
MLKYAVHIPYEHPLHYIILDLDDKSVVNVLFDEKEAQELKTGSPSLAVPLPEDIAALLGGISGMITFDDIWCRIEQTAASPRSNPGLFWTKDALKLCFLRFAEDPPELGGVEVAVEKKNVATKVLNIKLPLSLAAHVSMLGPVEDVSTVGVFLNKLDLQAMVLRSPSGGYMQLKKTKQIPFPRHVQQVHACMVPLLTVLYNCRQLMSTTAGKISLPPANIDIY